MRSAAPAPISLLPRVSLPEDWQEALCWIEALAGRVQIPYAIVGSLGLAVSLDLRWEPTRRSQLNDSVSTRDLDIFLMGNQHARQRFRDALGSRSGRSGPKKIDVVPLYHFFTEFGPSGPALRYRDLSTPVDQTLFVPVSVSVRQLVIPVLHPRVHMHLIGMQPVILGKGRTMARALAKRLDDFPDITEAQCLPFHAFKRARCRRYPLRERILIFRMVLNHWEQAGRKSNLVAVKAHLRQHHPRLTEALRRLLG